MNRFRMIPGFVHVLVALFVVAQLSGVVSSPRSSARGVASAAITHDHHGHADHGAGHHHSDQKTPAGDPADACCGLHAYFVGVIPPVIAVKTASAIGELLALGPNDRAASLPPDRLDRPPRPLR